MRYEHLLIDIAGPVATVTLNRPRVRNAIDAETVAELADCFAQLWKFPRRPKAARSLRVLVLRGAGEDFCAGADIRWMRGVADSGSAEKRRHVGRLVRMIDTLNASPLAVVGRVHGAAYGCGLGLVAACDVAVAGAGARMCFSECRLGILPAVVCSFVLPKIGLSHTRRLYLTSEVFDAETARRVGLVHEAVPEAELDARVDAVVGSILRNGPRAVRESKAYLARMAALSRAARLRLSADALVRSLASDEAKEGLGAFLGKRPAAWRADGR
ncbi:MAG: enoyl-CoA hydratase-related protein [Elusimicrobiota bacterium]